MRVEMLKSGKREENKAPAGNRLSGRVKFEIYGEEMIQKKVKPSGASGRVYLPPDWVDRNVKIIRMD
jgi:putative transposon-encoded protein